MLVFVAIIPRNSHRPLFIEGAPMPQPNDPMNGAPFMMGGGGRFFCEKSHKDCKRFSQFARKLKHLISGGGGGKGKATKFLVGGRDGGGGGGNACHISKVYPKCPPPPKNSLVDSILLLKVEIINFTFFIRN